jgi:hypothetical protein
MGTIYGNPKSTRMWKYTKVVILDPTNSQTKFLVDGKKDEFVGVIMTYISWEIQFYLNGINCPHQV